jgi:hypothetical protein
MIRTAALSAALVLGLQATAQAGTIGTLDKVDLGEHWFGPKRTPSELQGRVVMIELWGFN